VPPRTASLIDRAVLLGPDGVARTASRRASAPEERWLLGRPRPVRESYAREVLGTVDLVRAQTVWLLRQPDAVRESYVRGEVLGEG
jgi:hypothetical protein